MTISIEAWLRQAANRLSNDLSDEQRDQPRFEARLLLTAELRQTIAWVKAHPEEFLQPDQHNQLEAALQRRLAGEPLPYILGSWEFYGRSFEVSPAVLIPRPETELLVENAIQALDKRPGLARVVDVGTGSGCIAVSLACQFQRISITAVDLSRAALQVARRNAARYNTENRIHFLQSDLLASLNASFDLICANLPYIPTPTLQALTVLRYEPALALDGGSNGLRLIERLLDQAVFCLAKNGLALFEIEASQGESAEASARRRFPQAAISILPDLTGRPRLLRIIRLG